MKLFFKLLGNVLVIIGLAITSFGVLASMQGPYGMGGVVGGGIFSAIGITIIIMNKKGYSW